MKTGHSVEKSEDVLFGAKFRACRKSATMTLAQLAAKAKKLGCAGVSASSLFNLETGNKVPAREKLRLLALAIGASSDETQSLLESAGYQVVPESFLERTRAAVERATADASEADAELLVSQIEAFSDRFRLSLAARADDVRTVIVPVAGWQARALAPEIVQRSLEPALHEIKRAEINEVVLVTAPGADLHRRLRSAFRRLHIRVVEQEQPSGLGPALLKGRPANHLGPVAVLLPDEVDPKGEALRTLVQAYRTVHTTIVGVHKLQARMETFDVLRYYGIAVLKKPEPGERISGLRRLDRKLLEKPRQLADVPDHSRRVAGRYILTSDVFESMAASGAEQADLTIALNKRWNSLWVHQIQQTLKTLSPYKDILDLVNSLKLQD